MSNFFLPIVQTYLGWTLFCLFALAYAAIEAIPATARALRPMGKEKSDV